MNTFLIARTRASVAVLASAAFLSGCLATTSGPGGGKSYDLSSAMDVLKGVSTSIEAATMTEADEIQVGREVAAQTLGGYPAVRNDELQRYLNQLGLWIALQSPRPDLPWRFAAVTSDQINAFAVPGGTVLITTGMLEMVANEAELACVIGHEVGHIVRKHHLSLLQKAALLQTGSALAQTSISSKDDKRESKKYFLAQGTELFTRGLDRGAERDADADGVLYAARAGYDPSSCLNFMKRLSGTKGKTGALEALYKTHPQASERVAYVQKAMLNLRGAAPGTGARPQLPEPGSAKP